MSLPSFSWSATKLACFELCPAKYASEYYYKTSPYVENEAAIWGNRVHKAAETFMKSGQVIDHEAFEPVKKYCELFMGMTGGHLIEYRFGLDKNWLPCSWRDAIGRGVLDIGVKQESSIFLGDYKTGRSKDDNTQLEIYAIAFSKIFPHVDEFNCKYIWIEEGKTSGFKVGRDKLVAIERGLVERVNRMRYAHENENFPERRNGLCKRWCGNTSCAHCGG